MQTVDLSWQHSGEIALVLAAAGGAMALSRVPRVRAAGAFVREAAVIGVLWSLWQLAGKVSLVGPEDAYRRAHWIQSFERNLPLPSERSLQHLILGHRLVVQTANLYYAAMHLSMMLAFLIWVFARHRDRYREVRMVMAWTTLACLVLQLLPVAPPRLLSGYIDTGTVYNQSVYNNGFPIDQLSAMPSVHVAWAVLIGYYAWRISTSGWRWLGPTHTVVTVFVVVATANHWWMDGIVAVAILIACAWAVRGVRFAWRAALGSRRPLYPPLEPVGVLD